MSPWIKVGRAPDPSLPKDTMTEAERSELHRLLAARQALREQFVTLEQQLELLLLAMRDGRGLASRIKVDPESGRIETDQGEE